MVASSDSVGRAYVAVALHLARHPVVDLPDPVPEAWDDWCARAEAILTAAQGRTWTADATQAALETAARATVIALAPSLFLVANNGVAETVAWRPLFGSGGCALSRSVGLPSGDDFDRIAAPLAALT